ncbi:hypothetical protein [Pseudidiomarina insulisalsae]|uniref:Uncharacterized protein n=1 Tax=Pseudidiomarina insulisalsae TaxID=575789 RepID=A0A432YNJ4_9GAMM|nr:hypothetical protein [Pseudidiomarina insulisalsae]RUO62513.1 hypothetical protein CWI71_03505 [Pseudidiomarina insulisalsae]
MNTFSNNAVKIICSAAFLAAVWTPAVSAFESQDKLEREPAVKAQQTYRYTYKPDAFKGSIAENVAIAQAEIMADLKAKQVLDIAAALDGAAYAVRDYGLIARVEISLPQGTLIEFTYGAALGLHL